MPIDLEGSRSGYTDAELSVMDSFGALLEDHCPSSLTRRSIEDISFAADDLWGQLGAPGWTSALFHEELGGQGLQMPEASALLVEAGRYLVPAPFLSSAVLVPVALRLAGPGERLEGISDVVEGRRRATLALVDEVPLFPVVDVQASIKNKRVTGTKKFALDAAGADFLLVVARDENGHPALAWVPNQAPAQVLVHPTLDGRRVCTVTLSDAPASSILPLGDQALLDLQLRCALLVASYQLGAAERALSLAIEYARTRVQFDRPIGAFQAVSHRLVDAYCKLGVGRALLQKAARSVDQPFFDTAASRAKIWINDMFRSVTKGALQTFGGIGATFDHDIHLYFRAAHTLAADFGSSADHRRLLRDAAGLSARRAA